MAIVASNPTNVLTNAQRIALASALQVLVNQLGCIRLINTDYQRMVPMDGSSIAIPFAGDSTVKDIKGAPAPTAGALSNPAKKTLALNFWKGVDNLTITDVERVTVSDAWFAAQLASMARQLAEYVDAQIIGGIKSAAGTLSTTANPLTNAFGTIGYGVDYDQKTEAWRAAYARLTKNKQPTAMRYALLGPDTASRALSIENWVRADARGDMMPITTTELGVTHNVRTYQTGNVPSSTIGTGANAINGAAAVGATQVTVDGSGALPPGAVVRFGTDPARYFVMGTSGAVKFLDRPLERAVADNATITKLAAEDSVMFHRDCLTFAMRAPSSGNTATEEVFTDAESGISLRLMAIRQENQTKYQLDCLYGMTTLRDNAAVLLRT